ncbi:chromosome segregation protein SMC [Zavarzinia compransoris]|uniref:chromosome segregation protein SMC n=1 Tax=Zavarzinia marina TaxID=2911065 RepID=UPI001F3092AC|nr:chromosome segregation protein SMC [Zavarzinia marina]MCF4165135.1 chromosome segregation protein SMC [Zavarzinia marina]
MVQFTKLRLSGFKSFVDPTEMVIQPGMTGIVGPNGCGKSNLLEALRWVMGETSARLIRGSEMDDVIFAGTAKRPARNLAEVSLVLDNSSRRAPVAFNDHVELEISRRIEREAGSAYRINGKDVRARDVQLLFADASVGSRSPALVGQGRIGAIINSKPRDRRQILEEAAGISGLHSRRHEAELRLKAAENNLVRVDDVVGQLSNQANALKRQARQATRYRNVQAQIRKGEAVVLHLKWQEDSAALEAAKAELAAAQNAVRVATEQSAHAVNVENRAAEAIPPLREEESRTAQALHKLVVERDTLALEERRAREALSRLMQAIETVERDRQREEALQSDAGAALERLAEEQAILEEAEENSPDDAEAAEAQVAEAGDRLQEREAALDAANRDLAAIEAKRQSLEREIREVDARLARLAQTRQQLDADQRRLDEERARATDLEDLIARLEAAQAQVEAAEEAVAEAESARAQSLADESEAREALRLAEKEAARVAAEEKALAGLLAAGAGGEWPPMVDSLTVEKGYEPALGAALGDDLSMPLDPDAPVHWATLPDYDAAQPLPAGVEPLSSRVQGPPALARRLAQIGIVARDRGAALHAGLLPGQVLVSPEGDLWRWDGFTAAAEAPTAAAIRLEQRNRLIELTAEREALDEHAGGARAEYEAARQAAQTAQAVEIEARRKAREAGEQVNRLREEEARASREAVARETRAQALAESVARMEEETAAVADSREALLATQADLPPRGDLDQNRARLQSDVEMLRQALSQARAARDGLKREVEARRRRLGDVKAELAAWTKRAASAEAQMRQLHERRAIAEEEREELAGKPDELREAAEALADRIEDAERRRRKAADSLAAAEQALAESRRAARTAESDAGALREARVRAEAGVEQAQARMAELADRVLEELDCAPDEILAAAEVDPEEALPALADLEHRLDRLRRERDGIGPVNLRADQECEEIEGQIAAMTAEREDLVAAIGKLRASIGSLNREGRERLLAAFEQVNQQFGVLFTRLFGGGRAHLALVESDDPLDAGLEIYASPPGKKLQVLSLLSGGEQTLTALSLIFAVFMVNPSPICVLDEADAPLDDANVVRFCDLVEEVARETGTRFLVVTHHGLTMQRMHRLFGVTMSEPGISTLVSVDLTRAPELLAAE